MPLLTSTAETFKQGNNVPFSTYQEPLLPKVEADPDTIKRVKKGDWISSCTLGLLLVLVSFLALCLILILVVITPSLTFDDHVHLLDAEQALLNTSLPLTNNSFLEDLDYGNEDMNAVPVKSRRPRKSKYTKPGSRGPPRTTCFAAPTVPEDRRLDKSKLRFVSFNAEWLFRRGGRGSLTCPGPNCPWQNPVNVEKHFNDIAQVLRRLNGDMVVLIELEDCEALDYLNSLLPDMNYKPYLMLGADLATGQSVGLLTRIDPQTDLIKSRGRIDFPVPGSQCNSMEKGSTGLSKHYLTAFKITPDRWLILLALHLIAFPDKPERCLRREAQATVATQILRDAWQNMTELLGASNQVDVIVSGDLNDFDNSIAIHPLRKEASISQTLPILRNWHPTEPPLKSAMTLEPNAENRYSNWHDINRNGVDDGPPEHSLIDHVLLSSRLYSAASAWSDHSYEMTDATDKHVSDHWPVIVDIDLNVTSTK